MNLGNTRFKQEFVNTFPSYQSSPCCPESGPRNGSCAPHTPPPAMFGVCAPWGGWLSVNHPDTLAAKPTQKHPRLRLADKLSAQNATHFGIATSLALPYFGALLIKKRINHISTPLINGVCNSLIATVKLI